jgi:hypothetical protein
MKLNIDKMAKIKSSGSKPEQRSLITCNRNTIKEENLQSTFILCILFMLFGLQTFAQEIYVIDSGIQKAYAGGYLITSLERVDDSFNAGYSMYVAAYPLLQEYPGREFQSGLFATWMDPHYDAPLPVEKLYTDIEGGLGWWRGTQYATTTPKFSMGGVQVNFIEWANGPGSGKGRDWDNPKGKYGVAQLSPWVIWPPDGLNLKQGTSGELFGSGYLPLPLTEPKSTTAGKDVSTGNQCWTLFLNTGNFKGPVTFFTPYFWSKASVKDPRLDGLFLDQRPSIANKAFQMETQHVHSAVAKDAKGNRYARMTPTQFPAGPDGNSELLHLTMVYNKTALWDDVESWFKGGEPADSRIKLEGATMNKFKKYVRSNWGLVDKSITWEERTSMNITDHLDPNLTDSATFRVRWDGDLVKKKKTDNGYLVTLPEYYKFEKGANGDPGKWIAVAAEDVPAETGLHNVSFSRGFEGGNKTYVTPETPESCWKTPGPVAGPFKVKLKDRSTVTYYWYRFADQPALLNADLTPEEREEMQRRVEKLHKHWTKEREYLPPPMIGKLADIDPDLIVTPPKGLEIGYVPIVTRQGIE